MPVSTVVIQNAPYQSENKAWHALHFADAAMTEDMTVKSTAAG